MKIAVLNNNTILTTKEVASKVDAINLVKELYNIDVNAVKVPLAITIGTTPYVIMFKGSIPNLEIIKDNYRNADVLILDDFSVYPDKVRSYYASYGKEELLRELLKYRTLEVANGNACTII